MNAYKTWISRWLENNRALGACQQAVTELVKNFPELTVVKGHVYCPAPWGRRAHWWATAPDGSIVDPTASQFPGIFEYEPWVPGTEVRVGKCMNCGCEIWEAVESIDTEPPQKCICSPECHADFAAYLEGT